MLYKVKGETITISYFSEFVGLLKFKMAREETSPSSTYEAIYELIEKKAVTKTVEALALKELRLSLDDFKARFRKEVLT